MIKVKIQDKSIIITGHADFDTLGKDIVCASASSIVITSINAILRFNKEALEYKEAKDKLKIDILSNDNTTKIIIENMILMLKELSEQYPKNIKVEEERP